MVAAASCKGDGSFLRAGEGKLVGDKFQTILDEKLIRGNKTPDSEWPLTHLTKLELFCKEELVKVSDSRLGLK